MIEFTFIDFIATYCFATTSGVLFTLIAILIWARKVNFALKLAYLNAKNYVDIAKEREKAIERIINLYNIEIEKRENEITKASHPLNRSQSS